MIQLYCPNSLSKMTTDNRLSFLYGATPLLDSRSPSMPSDISFLIVATCWVVALANVIQCDDSCGSKVVNSPASDDPITFAAVQGFRNGEIQLLVTTDVMGRGLDIPGISHVAWKLSNGQ